MQIEMLHTFSFLRQEKRGLYGILKNYRYCIDASHFININLLLINVKFTKKLVWKHFDRAFMKL